MTLTVPVIVCFVLVILAFITGMLYTRKLIAKNPDGIFFIDLENPNEDTMKLQIDLAIEEIPRQKYLIFKVQK